MNNLTKIITVLLHHSIISMLAVDTTENYELVNGDFSRIEAVESSE